MFVIYVASWKHLGTASALKCFSKVDRHDVAFDRVLEHHLVSSAPVPEAIGPAVLRVHLCVPLANVSADVGSGANDPHPTGVVVFCPLAFVDTDRPTPLNSAHVEVILIDPRPFDLDSACTLVTSAARNFLLWGAINYDRKPFLVTGEVSDRAWRRWGYGVACREHGVARLMCKGLITGKQRREADIGTEVRCVVGTRWVGREIRTRMWYRCYCQCTAWSE